MILLVRHGETRSNLERRYHGRLDSPLTPRGIAQAQAIGRRISALPEAASADVVASPQPRAVQTADIIREFLTRSTVRIRVDPRLCEISIGAWEGLGAAEIEAISPGIFDGDGRHNWFFRSPGGETYDAFVSRIRSWLGEVRDGPPLIAVTHGVVTRVLRGLYGGLSRSAALALSMPQNSFFRLSRGAIVEIPVETVNNVSPISISESRGSRSRGR